MRRFAYLTVLGLGVLAAGAAAAHKDQGSSQGSGADAALHQTMERGAQASQAMRMTGDLDYDFVMAMRDHHKQAIEMANLVLEHGKDDKAREFARKTVDTQRKDIADFEQWLSKHSPSPQHTGDHMQGMQH